MRQQAVIPAARPKSAAGSLPTTKVRSSDRLVFHNISRSDGSLHNERKLGAIATSRGQRAEAAARDYLAGQGWSILGQNQRTPLGELDLVCQDDSTLVVVEVKARSGLAFGDALEAIGPRKERRLRAAAMWWRAERCMAPSLLRFDVIVVGLDDQGELMSLCHLRDVMGSGR